VQRVENLDGDIIHTIEEPAVGIAELASMSATTLPGTVDFEWEVYFEHRVDRFVLERAESGGFVEAASKEGRGTSLRPASYYVEVGGLASGTHTFRLRTDYGDGRPSVYGDEIAVSVPALPPGIGFTIKPNPSAAATVTVTVDRPQTVAVTVYDVRGRMVEELFNGRVDPTERLTLEFVGRNTPAGIYFIRAEGLTFNLTRKLSLVR
jgi:hypothetical protein